MSAKIQCVSKSESLLGGCTALSLLEFLTLISQLGTDDPNRATILKQPSARGCTCGSHWHGKPLFALLWHFSHTHAF